jgi:hypothetical protein
MDDNCCVDRDRRLDILTLGIPIFCLMILQNQKAIQAGAMPDDA